MPIYEYACAACGHEFEEWQKITDARVTICPKCHEEKVERLISRTAFQLKGGGWYSDLYSSSKSAGGDSKSGSGSKSGDSSSSGSSEGKSGDAKTGGDAASGSKKADTAKKAETRAA